MKDGDTRWQDGLGDGGGDGEHDGGGDQPPRIDFVGIRGGQGTSTVAAATALLLGEIRGQVRLESSDLDAAAALLGVALVAEMPTRLTGTLELAPLGSRAAHGCSALVSDVGQLASAASERAVGRLRIGVLRGPCYVALRELVGADSHLLGGLVLCAEAGRSLDRRDVEDIAGLPVLATVDVTPAVARTLDAGLATTRLARMREFAHLRRWLTSLVSGPSFGPDRGAPRPVAFRSEPVEKTCTDWHLPPRAEGADIPSLGREARSLRAATFSRRSRRVHRDRAARHLLRVGRSKGTRSRRLSSFVVS